VPRTCRSLLRSARLFTARVVAIARPSEARPAERKQIIATGTSLKAKRELSVHRPAVVTLRAMLSPYLARKLDTEAVQAPAHAAPALELARLRRPISTITLAAIKVIADERSPIAMTSS